MDRHERFMQQKTVEIKHLLKRTPRSLDLSSRIFPVFYAVIQDSYKHSEDLEILETLRAMFCLFYQFTVDSLNKRKKTPSRIKKIMIQFGELDVEETESMLDKQLKESKYSLWTEVSVVLDILVLYMTLYCEVSKIWENLEELQNQMCQHLEEHKELTIFHTKLMQCYIDSLLLHRKRPRIVVGSEGEKVKAEVKALYLQNVELCLKLNTRKECDLLTVILPKLIEVVTAGEMLATVWTMLFTLTKDPAKTLAILHSTADVWFPITSKKVKELLDQSLEERLWLLLQEGLSSPIDTERMQALQVVKRVVDFVAGQRTQALQFCDYSELRPLVCIGDSSQQELFKANLNIWFLVLEELEEDGEHFVTQGFSLLRNLFKETSEVHGFHIGWIRCILARILQDASNAVVKWGLLEVFTLDLKLYNDEFLSLVIDALNNISFYENDVGEEEPTVVKKISIFLNHAEANNTDLVMRFIMKASKITWKPVPLFYFIHALSTVTKVKSVWKEAELDAVKSLAEKKMDCPMLRLGSHIELLEAMTHFATESLDLIAVAKTLSAFSTNEALIRGQLSWKRTSAWLSKLVKKDEALSFLENICGQVESENSQKDVSMKSLSLIIMLLHDGDLLFHSESCPGLTILRNSLDCLINANPGPYDNSELENRSIELVHHLLNLASSKDRILYEFISNYADATLRFTFRILRHVFEEAVIQNIDTYVQVTQKFFGPESLAMTKPVTLNRMERFEIECWNIIDDKQWSNNLRRFFGIKILHGCLKSTSAKLKNYKFIGPLCEAYRIPMTQGAASNSQNEDGNLEDKIASGYYKFVAQLFCDYLEDEPSNEWLPGINWIEEVSYLIQVGGKDIYAPLVGVLSQIFFKEVLRSTDIADFKSVVRLCWDGVKECGSTTEEMMNLIFSSPFLECEETRELTIECTREIIEKGEEKPELLVILLRGLERLKGEYLGNFYDVVLACLLHGRVPALDEKIEQQACSHVLECYQEVYPNYLSAMHASSDVAVRAHAVTLLYKIITDDPMHGTKLLPLIVGKLNEVQTMLDLDDSQVQDLNNSQEHRRKYRIFQALLVLQPILEMDDIESVYTLLCNDIFSENSQPSVRLMQEWLLIRIYLDNESLRAKIWDLLDQGLEKRVDGVCSALTIVYYVARLLSTDLQLDFINALFQHIMPCFMSHELNVRLNAQAVMSKLYELASEKSYSTVAEKYKELYTALTKSLKRGEPTNSSIRLEHDFNFTIFDPINDYSLETMFYELPRLSKVSSDEYIPPQLLEKFGFKEANSHPLKLLNLRNDTSELEIVVPAACYSRNEELVLVDSDGSEDCANETEGKSIPDEVTTTTEDKLAGVPETLAPN